MKQNIRLIRLANEIILNWIVEVLCCRCCAIAGAAAVVSALFASLYINTSLSLSHSFCLAPRFDGNRNWDG